MSLADKFIKRTAPYLSKAIGFVRNLSSHLTPEDDWVEGLRKRLLVLGHDFTAPLGRPLITAVPDDDYVCTVDANSDRVEVALSRRYQRNLTSTRKYRAVNGVRDWADGAWVFDPDDKPWQHHVYLFDNEDGTTDVYAHKETSAESDPYGHVTDPQEEGDPDGLARGAIEESGLSYVG